MGVETGGCPHTAIREDASINLAAVDEMRKRFPALDLILIESGGDNLAATFSPELADLTIYVIDVSGGEKIPRQGRAGRDALGLAGHQQDGSGPLRRRLARRDGARLRSGCARRGRSWMSNMKTGEGVDGRDRVFARQGRALSAPATNGVSRGQI